MWEVFPYMLSASKGVAMPPPQPQACACPQTPDGLQTWVLRPMDRVDVLRSANRMRVSEEVHCMVLALPNEAGLMTQRDLRAWAEEAAQRSGRVVTLQTQKGRFPCGEKACCRCHKATREREQQAAFSDAFGRDEAFIQTLAQRFPSVDEEKMRFLRAWALEENPKQPGTKITMVALAKQFKVTTRTLERWLDDLRENVPELVAHFEHMREQRVRKTGAYEVRD